MQRALDARTVYLASAEPLRVRSTGDALVISQSDGRVQRIPISRVLRVVCTDTAEWSGAALSLCMQRGVSIGWIDHLGEAQGHLWPQRRRPIDLAAALQALASDSPDWPHAYRNWLRRQRLQVLQRWQGERAAKGNPVADAEWQCAKQQYVYRDELAEHLPTLLRGLAATLVVSRLSECGLQPHYDGLEGDMIDLAGDITRLVWAEMNLCAGPLADAIDHPREASAIFERWAGHCCGAIHQHLAHLRAHAMSELAV